MNITWDGELILVALLGWAPLVIAFASIAAIVAIFVPRKHTYRQRLSKVLLWAGGIFLPLEILFMRFGLYGYEAEQDLPPFWFYVLYGVAGMLFFVACGKAISSAAVTKEQ